jgi:CMP-N,N'-diacetyllegionaminic acid synthase
MKNKINVLAVVPARGGSKGILKKNIKKLNKTPLVHYILKTLNKINIIDRIVVSTDNFEIKKTVEALNFKSVELHKRPKYLSGDKVPLTSVVKFVADEIFKRENYKPHIVLQIAPTCPFIEPQTIIKIIKILKSKKTNCCVTLKRIEHEHPYRAKKLNKKTSVFKPLLKNINVEKFISRQDLPALYCTSGAVYGRTYELLTSFNEKNFCLGSRPVGVVVNDIESINIDRKIDFDFASFISKNYSL